MHCHFLQTDYDIYRTNTCENQHNDSKHTILQVDFFGYSNTHTSKHKNTTVNCMHDVYNNLIKEKLKGKLSQFLLELTFFKMKRHTKTN